MSARTPQTNQTPALPLPSLEKLPTLTQLARQRGLKEFPEAELAELVRLRRGILSAVASDLGVTSQSVYEAVEKYDSVRREIIQAREDRVDRAESALDLALQRNEPWAIALVLKTQGKKRGYTEKVEIDSGDKPGTLFGPNFVVVVIEHKGPQPKSSDELVVDGEIQLDSNQSKTGAPPLPTPHRDRRTTS